MITLPNKPKIIEQKGNMAIFEISPCHPGYGMTLGNAFRRVLLSSLPGAAITGIKIKGVQHEFSTIPHTIEDVVQIILNLKQIRLKLHTDQLVKTLIKVKGEKDVKGGDIKTSAELEVINKDAHIATLTNKKASLEIEIEVEPGLGYLPIEQRKKGKIEIGKIALDAIFSPIRRVTYSVDDVRVGERIDYDCLKINIETDGTIAPKEAFLKASQILMDHYKVFTLLKEKSKKVKPASSKKKAVTKEKLDQAKRVAKDKKNKEDIAKIEIEDLKISSRTVSVLAGSGLKTVAGLVRKSKEDLGKMEGLGSKGVLEIKRALGKLGLTLKS